MADGDAKKAPAAGISPDELDVAALFRRLQEEVREGAASERDGRLDRSLELSARADAERLASVAVDVPIQRRRGPRGRLVAIVKRVLRKLMSWYVGPFAADQRNFNFAVLRLVDELHRRLADVGEELARDVREDLRRIDELAERDRRLVGELEERVLRLERRREAAGAPAASPRPTDETGFDYFAFEARMRGTTEDIRERQRAYVDDFRDAAPVLDVGCGRGEFLSLLREADVAARGVETDPDMVAFARGAGLDVVEADAVAYLEELRDVSLGGVFAAQVLEHLPAAVLVRFLELAARKLRPGGLLVAETINPLSPLSLRHYFSDLTHAQPLVPETLALLARQAGFGPPEIRYLRHPPPEERLRAVELPHDDALEGARASLAHNVRLLNEHVFAALDYALVARTPS
jgi:O-antigen chain-terminating methyltransferase